MSGSTPANESRLSSEAPTLREDLSPEHLPPRVNLDLKGESEGQDALIVNWDGPDDPENPKNWSFQSKWAATAIVSAFTFISPVSSSMVAPATGQIAQEFGITSTVLIAMSTSIFVVGYAFGPLLLGPLSEIYGRSRVLQLSNMFYLAWNLGCGFAQNKTQLLVFRALAGLGGSAPLAIGGGVISDTWRPEERGMAIALYSLAPLLGPCIGPLTGAWIAEKSTWRWVFWATTICDGLVQCLGLFFLKETYAPVLLERKAARIRKEMAQDSEKGHPPNIIRTVFETSDRHWKSILRNALTRPFVMFAHEPIIQLLGVFMAFVYGVMYLFLTTIPSIFKGLYHESIGISGLHYLAFGIGVTATSQTGARLMDKIYIHLRDKNNGVGKPEFRIVTLFPGVILLPIGLLITGWTVEAKTHWIGPDFGLVLIGAGIILTFLSIQTYIIDSFTLHAASALAAVSFLRSLAGFGFPLFAPAMYNALGFGVGDTILAAFAIVVGVPAPFLFWKYGERIRNSSKHAAKNNPKA